MEHEDIRAYRFADCELRPRERLLLVKGEPATLGSRAFDVLVALIERSGRAVSRDELLDRAWPGLVVEENNLSVQISLLRGMLGRKLISTIPGIGYQFSAALESLGEARPATAPPAAAPAPAAVNPPRGGNLARFQSELIGREDDLGELSALVERHRLVTISGAGGIGKTRLALTVARELEGRFSGGAWLVEFAPLTDPTLVAATTARALGLRLPGHRPALEELIEALADEQCLLILDNCEHVVEAAGILAVALLERTTGVSLLTTSQELLKISYEQAYRLQPLAVPGPELPTELHAMEGFAAIRLLVARVKALEPRFTLQAAGVRDAVEICRRLDGLPLAVELAAARVPLLGLAGVRERLDDRLHVLTGGARSGLRRHRTLRETLAWSHALLNEAERVAFRRVGVFVGSFGLAQARRVLADAGEDDWVLIDRIASLVDKSLLAVDSTDPPRYRLLETARSYALEMLEAAGEEMAIRRRHAEVFQALFQESLEREWTLSSQRRRQRYSPDLENGRAALEWAASADPVVYVGLAGSIAWLCASCGQGAEGLGYCERAIACVDERTPPLLAARMYLEASRLNCAGHGPDVLLNARRAAELLRPLGEPRALYAALGRVALAAVLGGDAEGCQDALNEMDPLPRPDWPPLLRWEMLEARVSLANRLGRDEEARGLVEKQLDLARAHDDSAKLVSALLWAEQTAAAKGDFDEAIKRGKALIEVSRRENEVDHLHVYEHNLALALAMRNRLDEALPYARSAAAVDARRNSLWKCLELMSLVALRSERFELAANIVGCSDAVNAFRGNQRDPVEERVYQMVLATLTTALPGGRLEALRAEGATLPVDDVARRVLAD